MYYFSLATKYKVFAKVFKESFIVLIHVNPTDKILKFALCVNGFWQSSKGLDSTAASSPPNRVAEPGSLWARLLAWSTPRVVRTRKREKGPEAPHPWHKRHMVDTTQPAAQAPPASATQHEHSNAVSQYKKLRPLLLP